MSGGFGLSAAWAMDKPAGSYESPAKLPHQSNLMGDTGSRTHAIMAKAEVCGWLWVYGCVCGRVGEIGRAHV